MEMKFDGLTFEQKLFHFNDVAKRALSLWGLPENSGLRLLNYTENATFLITDPDNGIKRIMRVHRLDYTTHDSILTELTWIMALKKDTDISLPTPIPMKDGEYVGMVHTEKLHEDRFVVCFSFVEGKPPVDSSDGNSDVGDMIEKIEPIPDSITIPVFRGAAVISDFFGKFSGPSKMTEADREVYRSVGKIMAKMHLQSRHWK